jgi:hypothetical protein
METRNCSGPVIIFCLKMMEETLELLDATSVSTAGDCFQPGCYTVEVATVNSKKMHHTVASLLMTIPTGWHGGTMSVAQGVWVVQQVSQGIELGR